MANLKKFSLIEKNIESLLKKEKIHLNYYSGSGRYKRRSKDHTYYLFMELKELGVKREDFIYSNDAPRGGWQGYYIQIKNLKSFSRKKGIKELVIIKKKEEQARKEKEQKIKKEKDRQNKILKKQKELMIGKSYKEILDNYNNNIKTKEDISISSYIRNIFAEKEDVKNFFYCLNNKLI